MKFPWLICKTCMWIVLAWGDTASEPADRLDNEKLCFCQVSPHKARKGLKEFCSKWTCRKCNELWWAADHTTCWNKG